MHFNRQKFCCFRRELFESKLFASVLIISLEESWSFVMPPKRAFRNSKSEEEERKFLEKSVPRSTRYVTKWSLKIFAEWQASRKNKDPSKEEAGFHVELDKIQALDTNIVNMTPESLNLWLTKFVQEVCKEDGERYPPRTLCSITCRLQRHLQEGNGGAPVKLLSKEEQR